MNILTHFRWRRITAKVAQAFLPVRVFRTPKVLDLDFRRRATAMLSLGAKRRRGKNAGPTFLVLGTLTLIFGAAALLLCTVATAQAAEASHGTAAGTPSSASSATGTSARNPAGASPAPARSAADNPPANLPADTIGVIEGDAIAVSGPMSVEVVHGQVKTVLRSGSDVRVKSGTAQIALVDGGVINICGPAKLSLLKAAGALTIALESGTVHAHLPHDVLLTVYTAQIKAQPIAIGEAPQDLLVGFDDPSRMCIRATRGAVRIEQQLTGQSVVIPQTGDVLLINGQLESLRTSTGLCKCELQINDAPPDPRSEPPAEVSRLATADDVRKRSFDAKPALPAAPPAEKLAVNEEPIYQVVVPPLVYIANAKVQPEIDPTMIILVRRVRVRPTVIFQGRVLDEPVATASLAGIGSIPTLAPVASASSPATPSPATAKPAVNPTLTDRVRTFFNKIWPPTP